MPRLPVARIIRQSRRDAGSQCRLWPGDCKQSANSWWTPARGGEQAGEPVTSTSSSLGFGACTCVHTGVRASASTGLRNRTGAWRARNCSRGKRPWRDPGDGPPQKGRDEPRCGGSDSSSRGKLQREAQGTAVTGLKPVSEERTKDRDRSEQHLLG